jgi:hypothetical protein
VEKLLRSSSVDTAFTVLIPPGDAGNVGVAITQAIAPENAAPPIDFEYVAPMPKPLTSVAAPKTYADSSKAMTVALTDFPEVNSADEISIDVLSADSTSASLSVQSVRRDEITGITYVTFSTDGASLSSGTASVVIQTDTKKALPFNIDVVSVPSEPPLIRSFTPSTGACTGTGAVTVTVKLERFKELSDPNDLKVVFDGKELMAHDVTSFITGTSFTFDVNTTAAEGGTFNVSIFATTDPTKFVSTQFYCKDTTIPTMRGVFPDNGLAGRQNNISVFVQDFGISSGDNVFLMHGNDTKLLTAAARGGSPMEVAITLESNLPGIKSYVLSPCDDASAACAKRKVASCTACPELQLHQRMTQLLGQSNTAFSTDCHNLIEHLCRFRLIFPFKTPQKSASCPSLRSQSTFQVPARPYTHL